MSYDPNDPGMRPDPTPPQPVGPAETAQRALDEAQRLAAAHQLPADPPLEPEPVAEDQPRPPVAPERVIDDDEADEGVEWLSSGRIRLVWQDREGSVELVIPRPTVEEYEGYMTELEEMISGQIREQVEEEAASADPDALGLTPREKELREGSRQLRQLARARKAINMQKRLASYVLKMTRRPDLAEHIGSLPVWLGSPNFYAQLATHWLNVPLRSGDRPVGVIRRVK